MVDRLEAHHASKSCHLKLLARVHFQINTRIFTFLFHVKNKRTRIMAIRLDDLAYNLVMMIPRYRKRALVAVVFGLVSLYMANKRHLERKAAARKSPLHMIGMERRSKHAASAAHRRVGVNAQFLSQLGRILPLCVPGLVSREGGLLIGLAAILIVRTWLDIWFSGFNGVVVKSIVSKDWQLFMKNAIILFGFMMWPMSIVNNSLKLGINKLALSIRTRLTKHVHEQYLRGITFYKVANLDNRIQNADQLLTQDIDKFSETMTHLYTDIAKPLVDIGLFAYKLGESIGVEAPVLMIAYFATSGMILRAISPAFGRYVSIEQGLEGEFRYSHSRVIAHSEEIAFYKGSDREREITNAAFDRISSHLSRVFLLRFSNGIVDSVLVKYCATQLAFFILSRPVFGRKSKESIAEGDATEIMADYSRNSGYLINLSQSIGRIVLAGRDLTRFAGYTSRVAELLDVLEDINAGRYQRTMLADTDDYNATATVRTIDQTHLPGVIIEQDGVIEFDHVPITTPNGDVLVPQMSFKVESGMNCLITGPNGCGKSSLFRILGGLWPLFGGRLIKPTARNMFYVPQKPYLPLGTLRDQVIYPDGQAELLMRGMTDGDLADLLGQVNLAYLIEREGGWDSVRDWADVLSGGEKQRVAMARLFYHRPQFAILDECTSAVSIDVEGKMYRYARELGITLFTVSHRPSLFVHHEYLLRFDGHGNYEFGPLNQQSTDPFAFAGKPQDSSISKEETRPKRRKKLANSRHELGGKMREYFGSSQDEYEEEEDGQSTPLTSSSSSSDE